MEEEEESPAGAADAGGGGRGPRRPAGKYPKGDEESQELA